MNLQELKDRIKCLFGYHDWSRVEKCKNYICMEKKRHCKRDTCVAEQVFYL